MFIKSIKSQFVVLSLLFSVFVVAVLFQMYFTHKLQYDEIVHLQNSHKIVSDYLALEETERNIIDRIRICLDNKLNILQASEFDEMQKLVDNWYQDLQEWKRFLLKWEKESNIVLTSSVFDENFLENKKRQAEAYKKSISYFKEGKYKEAEHVTNIESYFLPSIQKTIITILDGIKVRVQDDRDYMQRFYFSTAFAILLALVALVMFSVSIFRNITKNLRHLEDGAMRISTGDFEQHIEITSPVEISSLANSFNEMQLAVKTRDRKIREDADEIQKLNEILEQKVVERNKTILQQNIALKRKNEELEQILYAASHDLRTPLISIQGFSEELKSACANLIKNMESDSADRNEKIKGIIDDDIVLALSYIISGSKRMELLLEALLRISRMGRESLQIKQLNMKEVLKNVTDNLGFQLNEADVELKIDKLDDCYADAAQMEQVFTNLIANAIKYRVKDRKCKIRIYSEHDSDFTRYYVSDNGIGIALEHQERIFHAFYRVDTEITEGDGVGLAIVNRAIDLLNGRVWVKSEISKGSTFAIELPNEVEMMNGAL